MISSRRRPALPTSAVRELGQAATRTWLLRVALLGGAVALAAVVLSSATSLTARQTSYFARGGGVVVLDLSTSVEPRKYQRIQRFLRSLSESSARVGLVVFSDVAYEMLPPGTPATELRALVPFFEVPSQPPVDSTYRWRRGGAGQGLPSTPERPSPWTATFRGGTRISHGLAEARRAIERDGVDATVVLVSDLDDSTLDAEALTQELIRYEGDGIDLRVVPLFAFGEDRDLFERLVGEEAFVQNDELLRNSRIEERQTVVAAFPVVLVIAVASLLVLLALNEHLLARVSWRRA